MEPLTFVLIVFEVVLMYLSISLHDMAQAWTADKLGDPTAKMQGRITINPMQHFDPWGMALLPAIVIFMFHSILPFGWSVPVPMTARNFRSKHGETLAVLAGSGAQLGVAVLALVVLVVLKHTVADAPDALLTVALLVKDHIVITDLASQPTIFPVFVLLYVFLMMNLLLFALNQFPVPFLDGGKILLNHVSYNTARMLEQASMWIMIGFMVLAWPLTIAVFRPLLGLFTDVLLRV